MQTSRWRRGKGPGPKAAWQGSRHSEEVRAVWAPDCSTSLLKVLGRTPRKGTKLLFPAASQMPVGLGSLAHLPSNIYCWSYSERERSSVLENCHACAQADVTCIPSPLSMFSRNLGEAGVRACFLMLLRFTPTLSAPKLHLSSLQEAALSSTPVFQFR